MYKILLLTLILGLAPHTAGAQNLFNGTDLTGWQGDPRFWSVKDGAITGRTTHETPLTDNTFLVWNGGNVRDFQLRFKVRIQADNPEGFANSGIQYRSHWIDFDQFLIAGYQADLDAQGEYTGMLYDEKGRGILADVGQQTRTEGGPGNKHKIQVTANTLTEAQRATLRDASKKGEWLDFTIIAERNHLRHYVNGLPTADVIDNEPIRGDDKGLLALQLNAGEPMTVQFKDIQLTVPPPKSRAAAENSAPRDGASPAATPAESLQLLPGYKAELIYTVPTDTEGSWVALTVDDKGRLITSDQYGALYRIAPPPIGSARTASVEKLQTKLSGAQGLLSVGDSLYVMVNETAELTPGVWRLGDTDGDDQFDETKLMLQTYGRGEHGPHALVLSPDKRTIYFAAGNHTALPNGLETTRPLRWFEDQLLPRMWDPNGHEQNVYAPGGYVARIDLDGKNPRLFATGFRNHYDIAFDSNGELFTHDSDMELDQGTPWYMPTRIEHIIEAGDYGWRSGAGRWPAYYEDSLPAALEVGPGSPTGMTFGTNAKFPAQYQRALFTSDWTFGTLYAVHLTANGASFTARKEEFLSGKPLPLTDVLINPKDGALYFIVGGRVTQSALYRVTYIGSESIAPALALAPTPAAKVRHSLEATTVSIDNAWPQLASPDRFIRYAARTAIEKQPSALWIERALNERNPQAAIEALIGLARVSTTATGDGAGSAEAALQSQILTALNRFELAKLPRDQRLQLLRAYGLTFTRMGKPTPSDTAALLEKFEPRFPSTDALVNRELASLLIYLDSPTIVAKTVRLLSSAEPTGTAPEELASKALLARNDDYAGPILATAASRPDRQQIAMAYILRNARTGWTPQLRRQYFAWFPRTIGWNGGNSFRGYLNKTRDEALKNIVADATERAALESLALTAMTATPGAAAAGTTTPENAYTPKGPGRTYIVTEATKLVSGHLSARSFERGKALFTAALCATCHHFNGTGGNIGPDLTTLGNRFNTHDILESIIDPGKVVSDQYQNVMPPGLINPLNPDELRDLIAYLKSAGNPNDSIFKH